MPTAEIKVKVENDADGTLYVATCGDFEACSGSRETAIKRLKAAMERSAE